MLGSYKYKFGGMEYQDEFDINTYDFGARNYDPALGRWMNIDPMAEYMWSKSPYNYAFDNPVYFIDPDGMIPMPLSSGASLGISDISGGHVGGHTGGNGESETKTAVAGLNADTSAPTMSKQNDTAGTGLAIGADGIVDLGVDSQDNPLQQHRDIAVPLSMWVGRYFGWSQEQIATQRGKDKFGLPLGPSEEYRYVINPYDDNVMDMRHVVVVGYGMGEVQGLGAEVIQKIAGFFGKDPTNSAFNPQDKYSNNIGASFFNYDFSTNGINMSNNFSVRFNEFLKAVYKK